MISKRSLSESLMPRPQPLTKLSLWRAKPTLVVPVNINQCGAMTTGTRTKILRLRKSITLYLLTEIIVEIEINQGKPQVRPRKILIRITRVNKASPLIPSLLAVTLLLSRKTRSRVTKTWLKSNVTFIRRRIIILMSARAKSWKTSVGLDNLCVGDYN